MKILIILIFLSGCASTSVCPPLKDYPPDFQSRLADEIEPLPEDSAIIRAIIDYHGLREMVRACR